jgi:hypothetical protein
VYYIQYTEVNSIDQEKILEFSSTFLSLVIHSAICMLYNIDFIITQYIFTSFLILVSLTVNHFIYEFGSTDYIRTTFFTISMVIIFSIGNYNLNKSIVL